jgi:hypothetical protein
VGPDLTPGGSCKTSKPVPDIDGFMPFVANGQRNASSLPTVDVAAPGGWIGTDTLVRSYQQADEATMLAVVMSAGQLREQQA